MGNAVHLLHHGLLILQRSLFLLQFLGALGGGSFRLTLAKLGLLLRDGTVFLKFIYLGNLRIVVLLFEVHLFLYLGDLTVIHRREQVTDGTDGLADLMCPVLDGVHAFISGILFGVNGALKLVFLGIGDSLSVIHLRLCKFLGDTLSFLVAQVLHGDGLFKALDGRLSNFYGVLLGEFCGLLRIASADFGDFLLAALCFSQFLEVELTQNAHLVSMGSGDGGNLHLVVVLDEGKTVCSHVGNGVVQGLLVVLDGLLIFTDDGCNGLLPGIGKIGGVLLVLLSLGNGLVVLLLLGGNGLVAVLDDQLLLLFIQRPHDIQLSIVGVNGGIRDDGVHGDVAVNLGLTELIHHLTGLLDEFLHVGLGICSAVVGLAGLFGGAFAGGLAA